LAQTVGLGLRRRIVTSGDDSILQAQLGREPRGTWRVAVRCPFGRPQVIATCPQLADGSLFPTLFWLTCPHLVGVCGRAESDGEGSRWSARMLRDPVVHSNAIEADRAYREARASECCGDDPCADTGTAGQRDPLKVKCLHARVAAALAGISDPVGLSMLETWGGACESDLCADLLIRSGSERQAEGGSHE